MSRSNWKSIALILAACCALFACSGNSGNTNTFSTTNSGSSNAATRDTATGPAANEPYPQEVADEFLKSCVAAGSNAKFCACMLEKVQGRYSLEEFSVIEARINAGTPPDEFVEFSGKARAQCIK